MGGMCKVRGGGILAIRRKLLRDLVVWGFAVGLLAHGTFCQKTLAAERLKASTSRASRAAATKALPLKHLAPEWQAEISSVVKKTTIYRRLPSQVIDCDPGLYDFLLEHPDLLVDIWEAMGISNVSLERTGKNTFQATDGEGTKAKLVTLHRTAESQLIYAQGTYQGPLFRKPIRARCVMHLRYVTMRETNGRFYVTAVLETFIKLDHLGVDLLAKTFHPLVGKVADYNFRETMNFVGSLSQAMEQRPLAIDRLSKKLETVSPEVRDEFVAHSRRMSERGASKASRISKKSRVAKQSQSLKKENISASTQLVQRNPSMRNRPVSLKRSRP